MNIGSNVIKSKNLFKVNSKSLAKGYIEHLSHFSDYNRIDNRYERDFSELLIFSVVILHNLNIYKMSEHLYRTLHLANFCIT